MINKFVNAWDKNKDILQKHISESTDHSKWEYEDLVKLLFNIIINPEELFGYDMEQITTINDGDYQGTIIFIIHEKGYQPNIQDYIHTNTYYGSCSGCDALQGIQEGNYNAIPTDTQVNDYMTLCLDLLQQLKYMIERDDK